jgi:hypothetical protein
LASALKEQPTVGIIAVPGPTYPPRIREGAPLGYHWRLIVSVRRKTKPGLCR